MPKMEGAQSNIANRTETTAMCNNVKLSVAEVHLALKFKTIAQSVTLSLQLVVCSCNCGNKLEYNKRNGLYYVVFIINYRCILTTTCISNYGLRTTYSWFCFKNEIY